MSKRERTILFLAMGIASLFLLDRIVFSPWQKDWESVESAIQDQEGKLEDAQLLLGRERELKNEWSQMKERLVRGGISEAEEALFQTMGKLQQRAGVSMDLRSSDDREFGNFSEIILETTLETDIEGLRDLLVELQNSEEYLQLSRFRVDAQPFHQKKSDQLKLDLRLSTIEYHPPRKGRPAKKGAR